MAFQSNHTKNSLLNANRVVKTLSAGQPNRMVSIQLFDNKLKVVPASVLVLIRYPSLRLSGVPDSIDPDGGHAGMLRVMLLAMLLVVLLVVLPVMLLVVLLVVLFVVLFVMVLVMLLFKLLVIDFQRGLESSSLQKNNIKC
jgi:hypothetical protein